MTLTTSTPQTTIHSLPLELLKPILHNLCSCHHGPCQCLSVLSASSVCRAFRSLLLPYAYRLIRTPAPPRGNNAWQALEAFPYTYTRTGWVKSIEVQNASGASTAHIQAFFPELQELRLVSQESSYLILCMGRDMGRYGLPKLRKLVIEGSRSEGPAVDLFDLLGKLPSLQTLELTGVGVSMRPWLDDRPYLWLEGPILQRPLTCLSLVDCVVFHAVLKRIVEASAETLASVTVKHLLGISGTDIADALSPVSETLTSLSADFACKDVSDVGGNASVVVAGACTRLKSLYLRDFCLPPKVLTVINDTYATGTLHTLELTTSPPHSTSFTPLQLVHALRESQVEGSKSGFRNLQKVVCAPGMASVVGPVWEGGIEVEVAREDGEERVFVWDLEKDVETQIVWDRYMRRVSEPASDQGCYWR